MNKIILILLSIGILLSNIALRANELFNTYPVIVEKVLYYKDDKFKVFYGGPIDRANGGVRWVMPVIFEDDSYQTRAVYEVAFVNCNLNDASNAEILSIDVSDINIKFQNKLSKDYEVFSDLMNGKYSHEKYIVIRKADFSIVYYPDIFISSFHSSSKEDDKSRIVKFLKGRFQTQATFKNYYSAESLDEIQFENSSETVYKPIPLKMVLKEKEMNFNLVKRIQKNDIWKVYYLISKSDSNVTNSNHMPEGPVLVRIDSGCISGQIYDDDSCDCLDQLYEGLYQLSQDETDESIVIHIPAHDGRGFGMAPKAETEIYKRGGKGRVHSTEPLDTVSAAKLLYQTVNYDFRTFDGAAEILKSMGIKQVTLLTDNIQKVGTLQKYGIEVLRKKTGTQKVSCLKHINSKKRSSAYYKD